MSTELPPSLPDPRREALSGFFSGQLTAAELSERLSDDGSPPVPVPVPAAEPEPGTLSFAAPAPPRRRRPLGRRMGAALLVGCVAAGGVVAGMAIGSRPQPVAAQTRGARVLTGASLRAHGHSRPHRRAAQVVRASAVAIPAVAPSASRPAPARPHTGPHPRPPAPGKPGRAHGPGAVPPGGPPQSVGTPTATTAPPTTTDTTTTDQTSTATTTTAPPTTTAATTTTAAPPPS